MELGCIKYGLLVLHLINLAVCDTRFECVASLSSGDRDGFGGGLGGDGFGGDMGDDFGMGGFGGFPGMGGMESEEFEGFGESDGDSPFGGIGGMTGMQTAIGSLTCPAGRRGSILVKRVIYGSSTFPGSCQATPFCGVQKDAGEHVAKNCDGKSTCSINLIQPKLLNCGQMSNYMRVEYECVDTWATFEICETVSTLVKGASIIITSPGYLGTSKVKTKGTQMCECIIQSHDKADVYLDYMQTQLVGDQGKCPYEFVLLESKKNLTQAKNDKEIEVCTKEYISDQWFQGSLRLTYASGSSMQNRGLLAKMTVDNIGNTPMIELECGKVPTNNLELQARPAQTKTTSSNPMQGIFPSGIMPPGMSPMANMPNFGMGGLGGLGNIFNALSPSPSPKSGRTPPDFSTWKIRTGPKSDPNTVKVKLPKSIFNGQPGAGTAVKPTLVKKLFPRRKVKQGKKAANKKQSVRQGVPGKALADGDPAITGDGKKKPSRPEQGGMVALVFSGIGSVLILGSVGILVINNYRKRQRIKREEAAYAYSSGSNSSTYGKGWKGDPDVVGDESVYATVAEVDMFRDGCVNPAVGTSDEMTSKETTGVRASSSNLGKTVNDKKVSILHKNAHISVISQPERNANAVVRFDAEARRRSEGQSPMEIVLTKPATLTGDARRRSEDHTVLAVIEVHRPGDEEGSEVIRVSEPDTSASNSVLHVTECLDACMYTPVTSSQGRCSECNITRPPRRRDTERLANGYDNNVGVKYKRGNT